MKYKLFSASMIILAALGGSAMAQEAPFSWTGPYAGVNLGGAWSLTCSTFTPSSAGVSAVFTGRNCPNNASFIGGGQIGYNYEFSSVVLGIEGDVGGGTGGGHNFTRTTLGTVDIPAGAYTFNGGFAPSSFETIRARFGYAFGRTLLYGTAGGAFAGGFTHGRIDYTAPGDSSPSATFTAVNGGTRIGWTAGGGIEYNVGGRWSVGIEDLYASLGTLSNTPTGCFGSTCATFPPDLVWRANNHQLALNVLRLKVNYNFGARPAPPPPPAPTYVPRDYVIYFPFDQFVITPEAQNVLQDAAKYATDGHATKEVVVGHTDTSGTAAYNLRLSERRAKATADALTSLGVPEATLDVSWTGEQDLAVPTPPGVKEPLNRRSSIHVQF